MCARVQERDGNRDHGTYSQGDKMIEQTEWNAIKFITRALIKWFFFFFSHLSRCVVFVFINSSCDSRKNDRRPDRETRDTKYQKLKLNVRNAHCCCCCCVCFFLIFQLKYYLEIFKWSCAWFEIWILNISFLLTLHAQRDLNSLDTGVCGFFLSHFGG